MKVTHWSIIKIKFTTEWFTKRNAISKQRHVKTDTNP